MKLIIIKKKYLQILCILLIGILILGFFILKKSKTMPVTYLPIANKVIAIDPGHGGVDPGAVSKNGIKEDEINLQIALKLKRLIEQSGGIVVMTRFEDEGLYTSESKTLRQMKREDLFNRKEIVNGSNSEIFISIHLNSFIRPTYYGAQTFYNKDSEGSQQLALIIQKELKNILDKDNNRQPQVRDDIFILNEVNIPSVLVECGFLSNSNEEKLLINESYQEKIAWAIYVGIMNYFNELDLGFDY
ncbi:N-acetylmuramoyl-L-alanine amidase CwlD [Tissierella pigra]|uniref:N-acetylmuramoyl-L-alanine amidase CwlD n=1 Tax=Tissierella pigra TaxID=2607614 RepID=A0A6N7XZ74_9FIRM|nr:N-acetylmuramoyl-L-alanine amidase CwlD [Tissierella pigra]MBU5425724.1 N-acetylmuramoyl-L-alanine amidase CwlD [Tissierella pigra]MSU01538.1 N-acetylmuramoyl-L-alanine amidase CwlD [Tissierella pigra]